jgi:2'-5' RNA ligase
MNVRLYFALWPDDGIRLQLSRYRLQLAREGNGRAVFPATLHMTLAFLGDVHESLIPSLEEIADELRAPPFNYGVNVAGCFAKAGVAWLGAKETPWHLFELQKNLQAMLAAAKFGHDTRTFRPHITVVRDIKTPFADRAIAPVRWPVDHFSLVSVHSSPAGPEYEVLNNWRLKG